MKYELSLTAKAKREDIVIILRRIMEELASGATEMTDYEKNSEHIWWELVEKKD